VELLGDIWAYLADPASYQGRFGLHNLLVQHLSYSAVSMVFALAIGLPLGLWVGHRGRGEVLVVQLTNTGRAVPDFGILLIAVLLFGLGPQAVWIALTALAVPPIVINSLVGIREVDEDLRDAAYGTGMTGWQVLTRVEVPLAVPLVMTGVRTAAVQVVATASLAGAVGGGGFGRLVFDALRVGFVQGRVRMIVAAVAIALLALATEFGLAAVERGLTPRGVRRSHQPEPRLTPASS
jgi:osmoprotectant transport system permease protein